VQQLFQLIRGKDGALYEKRQNFESQINITQVAPLPQLFFRNMRDGFRYEQPAVSGKPLQNSRFKIHGRPAPSGTHKLCHRIYTTPFIAKILFRVQILLFFYQPDKILRACSCTRGSPHAIIRLPECIPAAFPSQLVIIPPAPLMTGTRGR